MTQRPGDPLRVKCFLFDHRIGGPSIRLLNVYSVLQEDPLIAPSAVFRAEGPAVEMVRQANLSVEVVPIEKPVMPTKPWAFVAFALKTPRDILRVRRYLRASGAHVIHVNGAFDMIPALAAWSMRIPVVWHLNDMLFGGRLAKMVGGLVNRVATQVAVTSEPVGQHYNIPADRAWRLPVPINAQQLGQPARARPRDRPLVIGHLANWNPLKGQDMFVRMIAALRAAGYDVRGKMFGQRLDTQAAYGQTVDDLMRQHDLGDIIEVCGFASDVPKALKDIDLLLITSQSEGGPLVCVEAMAAGLPVVSTGVGDVTSMLGVQTDSPAGAVFDLETEADGVLALQDILEDPTLYQQMSQAGVTRAKTGYAPAHIAALHRDLYCAAAGMAHLDAH